MLGYEPLQRQESVNRGQALSKVAPEILESIPSLDGKEAKLRPCSSHKPDGATRLEDGFPDVAVMRCRPCADRQYNISLRGGGGPLIADESDGSGSNRRVLGRVVQTDRGGIENPSAAV